MWCGERECGELELRGIRSGDEERGANCSVTPSADVRTTRVCTAMSGFRPLHEGILQAGVCGRAGPRCECGFMVSGGHGYDSTAGRKCNGTSMHCPGEPRPDPASACNQEQGARVMDPDVSPRTFGAVYSRAWSSI